MNENKCPYCHEAAVDAIYKRYGRGRVIEC